MIAPWQYRAPPRSELHVASTHHQTSHWRGSPLQCSDMGSVHAPVLSVRSGTKLALLDGAGGAQFRHPGAACGHNEGTGSRQAADGERSCRLPSLGNVSDRKSTRLNSSHSQISYAVF